MPPRLRSAVPRSCCLRLVPGLGSVERRPIKHMTCDEFLRSDDLAKPEIVYWLATQGRRAHEITVVEADVTDSMVPALVAR